MLAEHFRYPVVPARLDRFPEDAFVCVASTVRAMHQKDTLPTGLELELLERVRANLRLLPLREAIRLLERGEYLRGRTREHSFRADDSLRVIRLGHRQLPPGFSL